LAGKTAIYGVGSILLRSIAFFLLPLYTRFLTPSDYGILAVTGVVSAILSILLPLSLHGALNPIYFDPGNEQERRANLGTVWITILLLASAGTITLDLTGSYVFPLVFRNVPFIPYIRLTIWTAFLTTFGLVPLNLFQIQERARVYVALTVSAMLLQTGLGVFFVVFQNQGAQGNLLGAFLGALVMTVPFSWLALGNLQPTLRRDVLARALAYSLPLVPHSVAGWVLQLSDRAILERFVSLEQLGLYSLGYTYAAIMNMIAYALNSAWVPFLFKTDAQEGEEACGRFSRLGTYFALLLCFVALGLGLFAQEVIGLMTVPAFHEAARVAPWIVAGLLLAGLYYFPINFLFLKRETKLVPIVTVVSGLLNVGLNLWLVPHYGIMAAAQAAFLSYAVMLLLAWRLGLRAYALPYEYNRLLKIGGVTLALWLAGSLFPFPDMVWAFATKLILVMAFPFALLALGFFEPGEKRRVLALAPIVARRIRSERISWIRKC
jgi:O-antigen/teichoic acid export membrane protein